MVSRVAMCRLSAHLLFLHLRPTYLRMPLKVEEWMQKVTWKRVDSQTAVKVSSSRERGGIFPQPRLDLCQAEHLRLVRCQRTSSFHPR